MNAPQIDTIVIKMQSVSTLLGLLSVNVCRDTMAMALTVLSIKELVSTRNNDQYLELQQTRLVIDNYLLMKFCR